MAVGHCQRILTTFSQMAISIDEIRKHLKEKRKSDVISRAVRHQNRIKFHAQTSLSAHFTAPTVEFLHFVENLLPRDKFKMFKEMFRYPIATNEVTGICFDKLSRIFDGRNPAFNYQFMNTEQRDDWEYYRQDVLNEPEVWATKGWEHFKTEINSVLIVDMPEVQTGDYPEPYFYFLPIQDVMGYDAEASGRMRWIAFRQEGGRVAVIDDFSYRMFVLTNTDNIGELLVERPHGIGYCPARFFWNQPISLADPDVKESPLTKVLERLDWYLMHYISKRNLDLYAAYPIYSGYAQACDFKNGENGDYCDGGYLKDRKRFYKMDAAGMLIPCPKCGNKRIAGVGSFVEVPIPAENQPDLRNPVQMLTVDRNSLDYNVDEEERLRTEIITAVVGTNEEVTTREALNEQQIEANFESQSTVLNRIKKGFEAAQQFVDETVCRLRYGNSFIAAKINYGTDFYIFDVSELRRRYAVARQNGASEAELDAMRMQILETEYRNNPIQLQRMIILGELEPYRHMTRTEVIDLYNKGIIPERDMQVKLNFNNFVTRFERENINILEFGSAVSFDQKIKRINERFAEYANELKIKKDESKN